jgi:uncharacterized protein YkwD
VLGLLVTAAVASFVPAPAAAAACQNTHVTGHPVREARATLCLINRERTRRGLGALKRNAALERAAVAYSRLMVRQNFFDHVSPGGSTPQSRVRHAGYRGNGVGETIAWGTGASGDAAGTVTRWLHSPPHRAILLSRDMRTIGIGVADGSPVKRYSGGETVTADFGTS